MFQVYIFVLLVLNFDVGFSRNLPSFIKKCKYSSDGVKLSNCLAKRFKAQKDLYLHGIPELQLPSLDPLVIDHVDFNTGNGTSVALDAMFTNVTWYGAQDVQLKKLHIDIEKRTADINAYFPRMRIFGNYDLKGRFLIMQLNGTGKAEGNFTKIETNNHLEGRFIHKNNKTYIDWTSNQLDLNIGTASMYFRDLFKGNPQLTETTNTIINENALDIIEDLKPILQETISSVTFSIMKRVFKLFSVEELFD